MRRRGNVAEPVPAHVTAGRATRSGLHVSAIHLGKRAVDLIGATTLLLVVAPVLVVAAVAILLTSPGPLLHRRRVVGLGGREFDAFKLRTMVVNADAILAADAALQAAFVRNYKLDRDPRVTP